MKQQKVTQKKIGESIFYIRPFPAFKSSKISGDLAKVIGPLLGGLAPILGESMAKGEDFDIQSMDIKDSIPAITEALSSLDGDVIEDLMKELMLDYRNVSVLNEELTAGEVVPLDEDLANEIFCLEIQDMYILCWEIIKLNFSGFFKRLGVQSGNLQEAIQKKIPTSKSTAPSTPADSQN